MSNMGYLSTLLTAGGAREGRAEERRGVDGDRQHRSARRGVGDRRRHGAGAGARDRAVADRRRSAWAEARRHRRRARDGHRQGPMVDRGRHLFLPLHAGHRGRGAHGGEPDGATSSRASRAKQLNVLPDDIEFAGGKIRSRSNPDNAAAVRPRRRHLALVAGDAAGRHGAGAARDRACGRRRSWSRRRATTASTPR